jgi:hypothetical protein
VTGGYKSLRHLSREHFITLFGGGVMAYQYEAAIRQEVCRDLKQRFERLALHRDVDGLCGALGRFRSSRMSRSATRSNALCGR